MAANRDGIYITEDELLSLRPRLKSGFNDTLFQRIVDESASKKPWCLSTVDARELSDLDICYSCRKIYVPTSRQGAIQRFDEEIGLDVTYCESCGIDKSFQEIANE